MHWGVAEQSCLSTIIFNHFVFLVHSSSFVQVWSEGLRYCKQPKESKGSVLEKFQSHQHNLGVAARSGTELPAIFPDDVLHLRAVSSCFILTPLGWCFSFCGTLKSTSQSKHFMIQVSWIWLWRGLSWRDIVKLLGAAPWVSYKRSNCTRKTRQSRLEVTAPGTSKRTVMQWHSEIVFYI